MSDESRILDLEQARAFAQAIGTSLLGDKCEDVLILDVSKTSPVTGVHCDRVGYLGTADAFGA